jgi:hypothetical protein
MIADGMFEGEPLSFDSIIARLDKLEKEIKDAGSPSDTR